jgi:hypothetical protein
MFSSRFASVTTNGTGVPQRLVGQSDKRYGIYLSAGGSFSGVVSLFSGPPYNYNAGAGSIQGFPLPAAYLLWLCVVEHGNAVQQEIWVTDSSSPVCVGILEVMACDCESEAMLRDALGHRSGDEDWHKRYGAKKR